MARIRATIKQPDDEGRGPQHGDEGDLTGRAMPSLDTSRLIDKSSLLGRLELNREELVRLVRDYAVAHRDQANELQKEVWAAIESVRPPSREPKLGLRETARRVGISAPVLLKDFRAGRLGTPDADGKPRFSEVDVEVRRARRRKPKEGEEM